MIQTLLLICALAVPRPACSPDTAADVIQGPPATSMMGCALMGQAYVAQTRLRPGPGQYLKVICNSRRRAGRPGTSVGNAAPVVPTGDTGRTSPTPPAANSHSQSPGPFPRGRE